LPTTLGNVSIVVGDESIVQFFVPNCVDMDFNKNLVLACIYMYYENALMKNKHTVCYNV